MVGFYHYGLNCIYSTQSDKNNHFVTSIKILFIIIDWHDQLDLI